MTITHRRAFPAEGAALADFCVLLLSSIAGTVAIHLRVTTAPDRGIIMLRCLPFIPLDSLRRCATPDHVARCAALTLTCLNGQVYDYYAHLAIDMPLSMGDATPVVFALA